MSKQDWMPRGRLGVCTIRVHRKVDRDPDLSDLEQETDPKYLVEVAGVDPDRAEREAEKVRERIGNYGVTWSYLVLWATGEYVAKDGNRRQAGSVRMLIESDADLSEIRGLEDEAVEEVREKLGDLGIRCLKTDVIGGMPG